MCLFVVCWGKNTLLFYYSTNTHTCKCHVQFSFGSKLFVKTFIVCVCTCCFSCLTLALHDEHFISFLFVKKMWNFTSIKLIRFSNRTKEKYDLIVFPWKKREILAYICIDGVHKWWSLILNFGIGIPLLSPNYYKVREKITFGMFWWKQRDRQERSNN